MICEYAMLRDTMDYLSIKQIAEKWNICERRVQTLCTTGRIEGAQRIGHQ